MSGSQNHLEPLEPFGFSNVSSVISYSQKVSYIAGERAFERKRVLLLLFCFILFILFDCLFLISNIVCKMYLKLMKMTCKMFTPPKPCFECYLFFCTSVVFVQTCHLSVSAW